MQGAERKQASARIEVSSAAAAFLLLAASQVLVGARTVDPLQLGLLIGRPGAALLDRVTPEVRKHERNIADRLSAQEKNQLIDLMERVANGATWHTRSPQCDDGIAFRLHDGPGAAAQFRMGCGQSLE